VQEDDVARPDLELEAWVERTDGVKAAVGWIGARL
jgi:hypothetical protein